MDAANIKPDKANASAFRNADRIRLPLAAFPGSNPVYRKFRLVEPMTTGTLAPSDFRCQALFPSSPCRRRLGSWFPTCPMVIRCGDKPLRRGAPQALTEAAIKP